MFALLFVLYLAVEIATFVWVASAIGFLWTIVLLLACSFVGLLLLGSQSRRVVRDLRRAGRGETSTGGAIADGALVAMGAVALFIPGLVTSAIGLLLLVPFTRRVLRPVAVWFAVRRFGLAGRNRRGRTTVVDGTIVDGTVVDETGAGTRPGPVHVTMLETGRPDPR